MGCLGLTPGLTPTIESSGTKWLPPPWLPNTEHPSGELTIAIPKTDRVGAGKIGVTPGTKSERYVGQRMATETTFVTTELLEGG